MIRTRVPLPLLALLACACATPSARPQLPHTFEPDASLVLVESAPVETTLDHPDVPNADAVWTEMFGAATRSIDIAEFYTSEEPNSRLTPVIAALKAAAARGVRVRFLIDETFSSKYPDTIQALAGKNIELRKLPGGKLFGGVLHAKYFVIDRTKESYLGSQNFDWRSLEHIQEMGVRIRSPELTAELLDVFETDWELAGGAPKDFRIQRHKHYGPVRIGDDMTASLVASPKGWLPREASWDLPQIIGLIDGARRSVAVQLLTYKVVGHGGHVFKDLDDALRRAAQRGVQVRLLVSDWSDKPGSDARRASTELAKAANVEVKVITIPKWSKGEIPFARVCHSKFLVVDGEQSWVGTSNWEGDYFLKSRNVGVVIRQTAFTDRLTRVFEDTWTSAYARPVAPMPADEKPKDEWKKRDYKADPEPSY